MSINENNIPSPPSRTILVAMLSAVVGVWFCISLVPYIYYSGWPSSELLTGQSISKWGSFGDTFGIVNSLFSGLAFAALLFTIWQQHSDLMIARAEFKQSLDTQKQAVESANLQNEINKIRMKLDVEILKAENFREFEIASAGSSNHKAHIDAAKERMKSMIFQVEQVLKQLPK